MHKTITPSVYLWFHFIGILLTFRLPFMRKSTIIRVSSKLCDACIIAAELGWQWYLRVQWCIGMTATEKPHSAIPSTITRR